ncbi:hypothetical protein [Micromonospora endophytica]|uniref:Uncharacterized protein n=1 Tax=Micromonospora endophytica TaxID=515350 RepID=A0A2W2CKX9_9ACTN|nr:hypothetical protein [Micromonospora endophytica]PZG00142.1 hypothetical protein C1I93_03615 [Micromonospora endophytica]RIW42275.1 hypothetical protein D3H59_23705 [Micromonospora endophytica]BCJ61443.1 hypothetical protein Jiend_48650 [Micromonospora endophytica]
MSRSARRQRIAPYPYAVGITRLMAHTDPVALTGIALSIALSVTLDLTGAASGVESLLAGLMGITISLLVDSLARAERRFHLRTLLVGPPWLVRAVPEVATAAREAVERHRDTRIAAETQRRFERFQEDLGQLRQGRIIRPGTDYQDMLGATRDCVRELEALTNVLPRLAWWGSDIGRRYWSENLAAVARGVRITRVFTYSDFSDELAELVARQRRAGVRVGLLRTEAVPADLHVNLIRWDGEACWTAGMSAHGEITENRFSVNASDVTRAGETFRSCVARATFDP